MKYRNAIRTDVEQEVDPAFIDAVQVLLDTIFAKLKENNYLTKPLKVEVRSRFFPKELYVRQGKDMQGIAIQVSDEE